MENRTFLKLFAPILMLGLFIINPGYVFAYGVETHAFLAEETVDFYNKNFSKKIPVNLKLYIIDGARLEDNSPRFMNHFYDPVNNRGLADGPYRGMASKNWSRDVSAQTALLYRILPQTEASLLTAVQIEKLQPVFNQTDFTWQKAIELYAKGEAEQALFALGHIIHLIEDVSVPEHTRNDAHPPYDHGGSPYENWADRFNLNNPDANLTNRLKNKKAISLTALNEYFDSMALYSNNNFYSRDSIKNYELPKPDYFKVVGDYNYGFQKNQEDGDHILGIYIKTDFKFGEGEIILEEPIEPKRTLLSYWSRLSTKTVQYGAGVIDLFFKEAEKAREKYLISEANKPMFARLIDGVGALFTGEDIKSIDEVVYEASISPRVPALETSTEEDFEPIIAQQLEPTIEPPKIEKAPEFQFCTFSTQKSPVRQNAIINEVAWMGSAANASDEWTELKNISNSELDITDWQVIDLKDEIQIRLFGKISAGGLYLLERTDDNSVPGVTADQIYTGALANVGEGLHLFNKSCELIDEVFAAPDWPAGSNESKRTMERSTDFSWRHYSGDPQNGIYGSPKSPNSSGTIPAVNYGGAQTSNPNPTPIPTPTPQTSQTSEPAKILISEILFDADGSDGGKEFIELYNPGAQAVDLSNWSIQHLSSGGSLSKKNFESGNSIDPKGFFLIWLGSDPRADLAWASGSLNNSSATIYLVNNTDLVFTTSNPNSMDSVSYDVNNLSGFVAGQSLERKASGCASSQGLEEYLGNECDTDSSSDFEIRPNPTPQNKQSLPEPRSAPAAVENFNAEVSQLSIHFNWSAIPGYSYELRDVSDSGNSKTIDPATTTPGSTNVSEVNRSYRFSIKAIDKDGLISDNVSEISVHVPPLLSGVDFYGDPAVATSTKIKISYNNYPFVPAVFDRPNAWKILVFYLNKDAPSMPEILTTAMNWRPENAEGILTVKYPNCTGDNSERLSLILPDTAERCSNGGGVTNSAYMYDLIGTNEINFDVVSETPFSASDYLTIAFYDFETSGGGNQGFRLAAVDKTKYFFREVPSTQTPE